MPQPKDVRAAGVVAFAPGRRVLMVHRPKYDDWSFPKGKLDPGEHALTAAVRETAEETGLHVRLGVRLPDQHYPVAARRGGTRPKTVHYWVARVVGEDDVAGWQAEGEVDEVRWVGIDEAPDLLTYDRDRETFAAALRSRKRTRAIVVLRHEQARSRKAWRGEDSRRPLLLAGQHRADRLVPMLAAFDVTRVVSSPSTRCVQTVRPYVRLTGWELETRSRLSEEDADPAGVARVVHDVLDDDRGAVVCSHRPVLPHVFEALGVDDPRLDPGEMLVAQVRKGAVVATERHRAG